MKTHAAAAIAALALVPAASPPSPSRTAARMGSTPGSASFVFLSNTPELDFGPAFPQTCLTPLFVNPLGLTPLLDGQVNVEG